MAAAQQDAQKAAQSLPVPHALDNLHAMINLVLISSGNYIKQHTVDSGRSEFTFKRSAYAANERFHDALDELEKDIFHAQTVLRRDLALKIADRKRRDAEVREKEAEASRLAAESSAKKNAPPPPADPPVAAALAQPDPAPQNEPTTPAGEPPSLKRDTEEAAPPAPPVPAQTEDTNMQNADLGGTTGTDDFDFDALFNDAMDTAPTDDNDVKMDTSGPDLNFSLDEPPPSLLRGLEDFANSGSDSTTVVTATSTSIDMDIAMTDFPDVKSTQSAEQSVTTKPPEEPLAQLPTTTDDLNLSTMTTDNLDDLFDLDYENPEATQFDDAFFGFGES